MLDALSLTSLLRVGRGLPMAAGVALVLVGAVYCFFGRRLFRLLIVGVGAAAGWEIGRLAALHLGVPATYIALPLSCVLAGLAWPAWQVGVFGMGGGVIAVAMAHIADASWREPTYTLYAAIGGLIAGGLFAVALTRAMSVAMTAAAGAYLVYTGLVAFVPFLRFLPSKPLVSLSLMGIVALAGLAAQIAQGDPEEARERRRIEKAEREAARKKVEDEERWRRYLGE